MNPIIKKLREDIYDHRRQAGLGDECRVKTRPLLEILNDYERMETKERSDHLEKDPYAALLHRLELVLEALWHEGSGKTDQLLLAVMTILKPLMLEREKDLRASEYARSHDNRRNPDFRATGRIFDDNYE